MKIVILGAGQVGTTLAENLVVEGHDIAVVDADEQALTVLRERIELRTVLGFASYPDVLRRAGAEDADILIAVTESDETNMLACRIAHALFHTPTKIARVRAAEYLRDEDKLFLPDVLSVDLRISPEQLVTDAIRSLIDYPGALQVVDFAGGRARLLGLRAFYDGPLVGSALRELPRHLPAGIDARIAAIYRRGRPILPQGDTTIEVDDEVFFVAASEHIGEIMAALRRVERPVKRVMIAGGGNIGSRLARALQGSVQVKLIERSRERARHLSDTLDHVVVLAGDAANEALLTGENVEDIDMFCAVTNDDEANILSAMLAKRLGARRAMSLINRLSYVDLVEGGAIDIAVSPQQATVSALLAHVRRGDLVKVHSLRRGGAEAIEAVAHGNSQTSKVVGRKLADIKLPSGTAVGAIVRGDHVIIAHGETVIEAGDHVILFIVDKRKARDVEKLFQVGLGFI